MTDRPRDEIWDALEEAFGEVRTEMERGRRNKAVKQLRAAKATPEEIAIAVDYCRRNFTTFTEMAVCGWLSRALHEHKDVESFSNVIELAMKRRWN
jgi:hypothetical protein